MVNNETILVTGATGFIGGRIVEKLYFSEKYHVRAGIHTWSSAARIGRFPIDMVRCDLLDKDKLAQALDGVDAVIHCAVGPREVTIEGTKNLIEIVLQKEVKRFVHISTVDVYGDVQDEVDETFPIQYSGNEYGDMKVDAEKLCWQYIEKGLPISIIRPAIVYGPFSTLWTTRFAERLRSGNWGVFKEFGEGKCNLVYVDDLVDGILAALQNENAIGEAFNIIGPDVLTWNEYFQILNLGMQLPELKRIDPAKSRTNSTLMEPVRSLARFALDHFGDNVMKIYERYDLAKLVMKRGEKLIKSTPNLEELALYQKDVIFRSTKAREKLGYDPKFDVKLGVRMSCLWLKHHGFADDSN